MHPLFESAVVTFSLGFVILAILRLKDLRRALAERVQESVKLREELDRLEAWCEEKDGQLEENRTIFIEPMERLGAVLIAARLNSTPARIAAVKRAMDVMERIAVRSTSARFDLEDGDVVLASDVLPSSLEEVSKARPQPIRFEVSKESATAGEALARSEEAPTFAKPVNLKEAMARMNQPMPVPIAAAPAPIAVTSDASAWSMADSSVAMWAFLQGKPDATVDDLKAWFPSDDNAQFLLKSCDRLASHNLDNPATSARTMAAMMLVHVSRSTPGYEKMIGIVKEAEEHLTSVGI